MRRSREGPGGHHAEAPGRRALTHQRQSQAEGGVGHSHGRVGSDMGGETPFQFCIEGAIVRVPPVGINPFQKGEKGFGVGQPGLGDRSRTQRGANRRRRDGHCVGTKGHLVQPG